MNRLAVKLLVENGADWRSYVNDKGNGFVDVLQAKSFDYFFSQAKNGGKAKQTEFRQWFKSIAKQWNSELPEGYGST